MGFPPLNNLPKPQAVNPRPTENHDDSGSSVSAEPAATVLATVSESNEDPPERLNNWNWEWSTGTDPFSSAVLDELFADD
jgi:hypothetical protein